MFSYDEHHPLEDVVFMTKTQYQLWQFSLIVFAIVVGVILVKLLV
jgi:hypothetical protein